MKRTSGILLPLFCVPSSYGFGTMGKEAYEFVDFLHQANQAYWQVLPLGMTSFGDSPYASLSSFAGGINYIDLDLLVADGYLKEEDLKGYKRPITNICYEELYQNRSKILELAYRNFLQNVPDAFSIFINDNHDWLDDFCLYMAIKKTYDGSSFNTWPSGLKKRDAHTIYAFIQDHHDLIGFYQFTQYIFFNQWQQLKQAR